MQKIPPNNLEAEQSIIGSILLDNMALLEASSIIDSTDFYYPDLRILYESILKLYQAEKGIDLVTLQDYLRGRDLLDQIGGIEFISKLALSVPTSVHTKDYAGIIKKLSHERQIIKWAIDIQNASYEKKIEFLQNVPSVTTNRHQHKKMSDLIRKNIDDVVKRYNREDDLRGLRTGFKDIDELTDGMKPSEVIGLWADSNTGKSLFASDIARFVAKNYGDVCFFCYEMSAEDMSYRVLADEIKVKVQTFNKPKYYFNEQVVKDIKAYDEHKLDRIHLFAEELETFTVQEIENYIRLHENLKLIVVDYLHLMETLKKYDKAIDKPAVIARELKKLARKYKVPILALMSQTKGSQESSMFVGTNELKHAVDQLWKLERDYEDGDKAIRQTAYIYVVKGRGNSKGKVTLTYLEDYLTFKDGAYKWK